MTDEQDALTGPTVFRRQLGRELRALRENAGYTIEAAAKKMEISRAKYGRIEHGTVSVRSLDVKQLCEIFVASAQLTKALVDLALKTREKGWWHAFTNVMPETFEMYVGLETAASELHEYQNELVPGLLQTPQYAETLFRADNRDAQDAVIEHRGALRHKRQRLLQRVDPPALKASVVLSEAVLRRPIGGPEVMADQLDHLGRLATMHNVSIRVIDFAAGLHPGAMSGPFVILRFVDASEPPTVYMDGYVGDLYLEKKTDVARYDAAFAGIVERSLDEKTSQALIARIAKEYRK